MPLRLINGLAPRVYPEIGCLAEIVDLLYILMQARYHVVVSLGVGAIIYAVFKSLGLALAFALSGIFIDLDHFIDYWVQAGFSLKIKEFFDFCYGRKFHKSYLLLHGWEWLVLLLVGSWLSGWNAWVLGTLAGFGLHLVMDQLANGPSLFGYSLVYRCNKKFDFLTCFPD